MPKRSYAGAFGYRFGFNRKENDNDVKGLGNQQDYGMRIYDPRVGKFLSVDPIYKSYPELTPYQFASNTPIQAIDIDGLEAGLLWPQNMTKRDYQNVLEEQVPRAGKKIADWWNTPIDKGSAHALDLSADLPDGTVKTRGNALMAAFISSAKSRMNRVGNRIPAKVHTEGLQNPKVVVPNTSGTAKTAPASAEQIETVTITRVQTQHPSSQRISVDGSGNIVVLGKTKLYITIDDKNHVQYYYNKKGGSEGGASIISFQVKKEVADEIRWMAVPQAKAQAYPDRPEISDPTKSNGAFGLPENYIKKLQEGTIKGTGKVENP